VPRAITVLADPYDCFLLDLDGVLYRADDPIAGAGDVTSWLREQGKRLAFVTNNSSKTPQQVADKLDRMGIQASADEVVTSALATASLLSRWGVRSAYVIGETGILSALEEAGIEVLDGRPDRAEVVVVGWDRGVTYDRLREAALLVQRGARLVATNADASYPAPDGEWPGAGAILAAITTTTGSPADVQVGKPNPPLFESALERTGGGRPLVVGDRMDTDVAGAAALGWDSLLVFSGVATPADLLQAGSLPTYMAKDLSALTREAPPSIRIAAGADADAIDRLLRASALEADGVRARLPETFVATTPAGEIVGTCALELFGPFAHLRSVAVDPRSRGTHVGTMLSAHAAREAAAREAEELFAVTETATGFFEALGFERAGNREALPDPIAAKPLIRDRCTDQAVVLRLVLKTTPDGGPEQAGPTRQAAPARREAAVPSGRTIGPRSPR
jgi:glycerol 3-phosphatase-2